MLNILVILVTETKRPTLRELYSTLLYCTLAPPIESNRSPPPPDRPSSTSIPPPTKDSFYLSVLRGPSFVSYTCWLTSLSVDPTTVDDRLVKSCLTHTTSPTNRGFQVTTVHLASVASINDFTGYSTVTEPNNRLSLDSATISYHFAILTTPIFSLYLVVNHQRD